MSAFYSFSIVIIISYVLYLSYNIKDNFCLFLLILIYYLRLVLNLSFYCLRLDLYFSYYFYLLPSLIYYHNLYVLTETCSFLYTRTVRRSTFVSTIIVCLIFSHFGARFRVNIASECEFYLISYILSTYIYISIINLFVTLKMIQQGSKRLFCSPSVCQIIIYVFNFMT